MTSPYWRLLAFSHCWGRHHPRGVCSPFLGDLRDLAAMDLIRRDCLKGFTFHHVPIFGICKIVVVMCHIKVGIPWFGLVSLLWDSWRLEDDKMWCLVDFSSRQMVGTGDASLARFHDQNLDLTQPILFKTPICTWDFKNPSIYRQP